MPTGEQGWVRAEELEPTANAPQGAAAPSCTELTLEHLLGFDRVMLRALCEGSH